MKKIFTVLLTHLMVLTGIAPAWAGRPPIKPFLEILQKKSPEIEAVLAEYRVLPTSLVETLDLSLVSLATQRNYAKYGEDGGTLVKQIFAELDQFESMSDNYLISTIMGKSDLANLLPAQQNFLFDAGLTEMVGEKGIVPTKEIINKAMAHYRNVLAETNNAPQAMSAVTNLGFFGSTAKDAVLILQTAKKFGEKFDPIAINALILLGAEHQLQALADFRMETSGSLPQYWRKYAIAINKTMGTTLSLPPYETMRKIQPWNLELQKELGEQNPYSLLFWLDDTKISVQMISFRQGIQEKVTQGIIEQQILDNLNAKPVQAHGVEGTLSSLAKLQASPNIAARVTAPTNATKVAEKSAQVAEQKMSIKSFSGASRDITFKFANREAQEAFTTQLGSLKPGEELKMIDGDIFIVPQLAAGEEITNDKLRRFEGLSVSVDAAGKKVLSDLREVYMLSYQLAGNPESKAALNWLEENKEELKDIISTTTLKRSLLANYIRMTETEENISLLINKKDIWRNLIKDMQRLEDELTNATLQVEVHVR